tara:strand:- start:1579 stop:1779 length:201 start_codon:yes stop_codon:yes gene_type:complete
MPKSKNKYTWRYVFIYKKDDMKDTFYFDIFTNKGKEMARKLAMEYMQDVDGWLFFKFIKRKKQNGL